MIHVAFNIDSNYVKHCAVTMVSMLENNSEETFTFHIITDYLSAEQKQTLEDLCTKYGSHTAFYPPNQKMLEGFSIRKFSKRISMATYYRCLLSEILPAHIDRVLYLDCDIVICGDIRPFWNMPLNEIGAIGVEDIGCREPKRYSILQYPMEDSYFNAGVLMVNLAYWREHNVPQACIEYFHVYPERILYNDQDLLNSILHKDKVLIDLVWNVQDGFYRNPSKLTQEWKQKYTTVLKNPIILHYTNRKPWDYDSQHPLRELYFKYLDHTPWKGWRPGNSVTNRVKRFFRLLPFYTGLRRAKYVNLDCL